MIWAFLGRRRLCETKTHTVVDGLVCCCPVSAFPDCVPSSACAAIWTQTGSQLPQFKDTQEGRSRMPSHSSESHRSLLVVLDKTVVFWVCSAVSQTFFFFLIPCGVIHGPTWWWRECQATPSSLLSLQDPDKIPLLTHLNQLDPLIWFWLPLKLPSLQKQVPKMKNMCLRN